MSATPTPDAPAAEVGFRLHAVHLEPKVPALEAAMEGIWTAWRACVTRSAPSCGYQVIYVEQDRHTQTYSMGWYVDELDGEVATCIAQHAEDFTLTPSVPVPHSYVAAIAVAPTPAELDRCADGLADAYAEFY